MEEGTVMTVDFEIEGQKLWPSTAVRYSNSAKRFHFRCFAKPGRRWTIIGTNFLRVVTKKHSSAVG